MSTHAYQREFVDGGWNVESNALAKAVRSALPGLRFTQGIGLDRTKPEELVFKFDDELGAAAVQALEQTVVAHKASVDPLAPFRERILEAIDLRTRDLIARGFEFPPGSGQRFSMSLPAQANWNSLAQMIADGQVTPPIEMPFLDSSGEYELADAAAFAAWGATGSGLVLTIRVSGHAKRKALRQLSTYAELEAFAATIEDDGL